MTIRMVEICDEGMNTLVSSKPKIWSTYSIVSGSIRQISLYFILTKFSQFRRNQPIAQERGVRAGYGNKRQYWQFAAERISLKR